MEKDGTKGWVSGDAKAKKTYGTTATEYSAKTEIKNLHDKNLEILQDIKLAVESKTSKIYNQMKPKIAADIFNQMIGEGKIDDVFDIILKLKESNVTQIMKFLSVPNASILTQMLENFNINKEKKD